MGCILQAILGISLFIILSWIFSEDRKRVNLKDIFIGLILQIFLAIILTQFSGLREIFIVLASGITALKNATLEATKFTLGYVGGGDTPFIMKEGGRSFIFAFQALPMVITVSALIMVLCYYRVLTLVVRLFSNLFKKVLGLGGALGIFAAGKIFLGQTLAPLLVRPYLHNFSKSELLTVMTAGMATTSLSSIAIYITILEESIHNSGLHLLIASIINIPAAITISRILVPSTGIETKGELILPYHFSGVMEAVEQGMRDGMKIYINIIAMLIVFLTLITLVNSILSSVSGILGKTLTLELLLGYCFAPLAWLIGIPWPEAITSGGLLGQRAIFNEVIAYLNLANFPESLLSERTQIIMVYALAGFANIGSIGVQIGGMGMLIPERKREIISLGPKALIAGTIASCMSGAIICILYSFDSL